MTKAEKKDVKKEESPKCKIENKSPNDKTTQWNVTKDALRPTKHASASPCALGSKKMLGSGTPKGRPLKAVSSKNATESGNCSNSGGRKVLILQYTPCVLSFRARGPTSSHAAQNGAMASVVSSSPLSSAPNSSAPANASVKAAPVKGQTYKMIR